MRNISLRGLYFMSEAAPLLKPDDIADFRFKFPAPRTSPLIPEEIRAKGRVKRIEPPTRQSPEFGVAVEFLSGPEFIYTD